MREIKKLLKLPKSEYYMTHLSIVNCLLPEKMTPKEIEVMALFMCLEGDITKDRFGKTAKKIIMEKLKLSPSGLSNHMTSMKNKGFLIETQNILTIWPLLNPEKAEQIYTLKLVQAPEIIHEATPINNHTVEITTATNN